MHNGIQERLEAAKTVARMAGELLLQGPSGTLETTEKGVNDFVTVMDFKSEKLIKEYLHTRFPTDNFLGEEMGLEQHGNAGRWVIDPIDGTTNYIHGLPGYSISIAYEEVPWEPLLGVVYDPIIGEMYSGSVGNGSYCQDVPLTVSTVEEPHNTVIMISPPLRIRERLPDYMRVYEALCADSGEMRDYGSAALHLCYIAQGRADAFVEFGLGYHDIAAGTVILRESGGMITHLDMRKPGDFTSNIIATNALLHDWFVSRAQIT